jgi:hypothetical protein
MLAISGTSPPKQPDMRNDAARTNDLATACNRRLPFVCMQKLALSIGQVLGGVVAQGH